ncbi:MAG: hypothetical protein GFH27_549287n69 [Chloroflexi bacterium AL-W]|nr:hypothetical protein [Chloroflexi bacterium AL-N1]NOK66343.1 hypothetical protein [Chloroflexi bacterium AL-N10]NOK71731.1 hypothetical protein [Chloroflexi bacterium AL-N5]NOK80988.1 hypothetical protein [Chloroflexi bacterium AL-W]NOK89261.1 hypothetical protein [Chloroflexi bacterium AL-N15]
MLFDGDSEAIIRSTISLSYRRRFVFIDTQAQLRVQSSRRPSGDLRDIICTQIPISMLSPYETAASVTGSRFFGREYEISRILERPNTNHLILGIRRIGKTSLLKEVERRLREDEGESSPHIIYLDCSDLVSADDYIQAVVRKLNPKELPRLHLQNYCFFFPDFLERMQRMYKHKIIFLLDEIDNLIIAQRERWDLFRMLRASSNKGVFRYICAGFREAMQEQFTNASPLFNFAQEVRLNEFSWKQARELIVLPMAHLGVTFQHKNDILSRIYEKTAGNPNLIQYYCMVLLRHLDKNDQRAITLDHLIDVYRDDSFKGHLVGSFMQNTTNREKGLIYALLNHMNIDRSSYFTQADMDMVLRQHTICVPHQTLDAACDTLKFIGILHQKGRDFSLTSPVFARVLQQTYDVHFLFQKAMEEGL